MSRGRRSFPPRTWPWSCLTNAVDGLSHQWLDGFPAILKPLLRGGRACWSFADWAGRWWSVWGPSDLLLIGEKVLDRGFGLANLVLRVGELTVTAADQAFISQAGAAGLWRAGAAGARCADYMPSPRCTSPAIAPSARRPWRRSWSAERYGG